LNVTLQGSDLHYTHHAQSGVVALGESRRGVALIPAYLMIAVFVAFAKVRPFWQIAILAVVAGPLAFFCNYVRLANHALVTIYADLGPLSPVPRYMAMISSLMLGYAAIAALCGILTRITGNKRSAASADEYPDKDEVQSCQ